MRKRSLYQCLNAKVLGDKIYCSKGHKLGGVKGGRLDVLRLIRGEPLELSICQDCPDYDEMGPPVPKEERGWANLEQEEIKSEQ